MSSQESLAHDAHPPTRELRALQLYRTRGHAIRQVGQDLYLVPACAGRGFYLVDYREETCDCPDFTHRRENCKHILAVGVHVAKRRLHVSVAGDPFAAAGGDRDHDRGHDRGHDRSHDRDHDRPCACLDGWVTIGQIVVDPETGEETEEFAQYLCRRCAEQS